MDWEPKAFCSTNEMLFCETSLIVCDQINENKKLRKVKSENPQVIDGLHPPERRWYEREKIVLQISIQLMKLTQ